MSTFSYTLRKRLDSAGISYKEEQTILCEEYFMLVAEANKHLNLTRITDKAQAAIQHFADAVRLLGFLELPSGCRVIDVGTGAGFPGIPLKIFRPEIDLALLDASGKKADFIRSASKSLGINATVYAERAEEAARGSLRESFDVVLSRAVAPLNVLLELCVPLLRSGGVFAAWKGENFEEELSQAGAALSALGCRLRSSHCLGPGFLLLIDKAGQISTEYPRRFSKIKSRPL